MADDADRLGAERLDAARRDLDLTVYELWIAYVGLGGSCDAFAVKAYLDGTEMDTDFEPVDRAILICAINETYADLGIPTSLRSHPD